MKKCSMYVLSFFLLIAGYAGVAYADLDSFLSRVNAQAQVDLGRYNLTLSAQFGVPAAKVDFVVRSVPDPASAFMVLELSRMTHKQPEAVIRIYNANRGKGWGAVAKELGIKPGSAEFHALKRGDFVLKGDAAGKDAKDDDKSKGKSKEKKK